MLSKLLPAALCFIFLTGYGQNTIALPEIINYSKYSYGAGTQNWKIAQDKQGILYFANDEGLLSFDGNLWKKYPLPEATGVRSLAITNNGRIYIGGQGEIGFFEPAKNGKLQYSSLNNLIPETEKDFTDIWDVILFGNDVFFRSHKKMLLLKNEKITAYSSHSWSFLGLSNGKLLSKAFGKGLLFYQNGQWVPFEQNLIPEAAQLTAFLPLNKDSSLIITRNHGYFILKGGTLLPFNTPDLKLITEQSPSAAAIINDRIVVATNLGGCFIITKKGEIIQKLSKLDGLQSNKALSVFVDKNKNLWMGLNNGIDFIAYNNAIKHIYPDYQERSAGSSIAFFKNNLYIGTANGLYSAPITLQPDFSLIKSNFEPVTNTKGQVWNLCEINGHLLMGHSDGFFIINGHSAQVLDGSTGFWTFLPLNNVLPSSVILGSAYNGLHFYNYEQGRFLNPKIQSPIESVQYIAIDNSTIWASHPYKGLYKIEWNGSSPSYTIYKDTKGVLSKNHNRIFKIKSRIVLTNEKGFFEYDAKTGDFEPSIYLKNIFGSTTIPYLKEDPDGNLWFIKNGQLGVADFTTSKPQIRYFPELNAKIGECIYPYNNNNIFIAGEQGFYLLNYEEYKKRKEVTPILISSVKIFNKKDSTIFGGYYNTKNEKAELINDVIPGVNYSWNSIHFDYSSALYGEQSNIEYSYYLEGFDKTWSIWSKRNEKDYTNLSPRTYKFKVKSRRHEGEESVVASYRFTILPPWYRTIWAYLAYLMIIGSLMYAGYRWQKKKFIHQQIRHEEERKKLEYLHQLQLEKHEEEQKQLMYLHQLELERNEKEIIRLRNEKLESEIELKNSELASTTLNLIQKGDMLVKVKEEFVRMKKIGEADKDSDDYKKIIRMLGEDKLKKNWEEFAVHFDKVHSDFLVTLKKHYPNITPNELKLCAYLRLNLSSKEIAQIMNITIKSVELSRYRLRKKLQIPSEVNLFDFLLNFHSSVKQPEN